MTNITKIMNASLSVKVILSSIIAAAILLKGDAGMLTYSIGSLLYKGSLFNGIVSLIVCSILYLVLTVVLVQFVEKQLKKMIIGSFILDVILILTSILGGVYILGSMGLPMQDALTKIIIMADGAAIIFMFLSVLMVFPYFIMIHKSKK